MNDVPSFDRARSQHRFTARQVTVSSVSRPVPEFARVTLSGPDLHDFVSTGPADHAKIFFPHPITGVLEAPTAVGPTEDGIVRPDTQTFSRDFTPLNVREEDGGIVFDIDLFLHENPGPASAWGAKATIGDKLVVVGPRGSRSVPEGLKSLLCIVDPTALPSVTRWIKEMPTDASIEVVADVDYEDIPWVETYLAGETGRDIFVREPMGDLGQAMRDSACDSSTFLFAAGDANRLIPLRRVLRDELGLPREQYQLSGYWRSGEANFDHHLPIDPENPDE